MRIKILLEILKKNAETTSRTFLAKKMNLSESSIRNLIREANSIGLRNGFQIELIKGEGYYLSVADEEKFKLYFREQEQSEFDVYNSKQRLRILLFNIFQKEGYFTFEQIAERVKISRATIVRDFKKIEKMLNENGLTLEKKAHYGLKIVGPEQNYRRAFSKFVLTSDLYLEPAQEFYEFIKSDNHDELRMLLSNELAAKKLKMTDVAFENVLKHIKILIFRARKHNFISDKIRVESIDEVYYKIARSISMWIEKKYNLSLPESETSLLSAHIAGKASVGNLEKSDRQEMLAKIESILKQIDSEFLTELSEDKDLKEALLLHMFPLLSRMYNNLLLENPMIDEVYMEYANVFLIAFRFSELIEADYRFKLTIDEVGYLALHFAAHFERLRYKFLERYKRIVVICSTGGGSAQLLRLKLEQIFPKATIVTSSASEIHKFKDELPDLFLTTIPIEEEFRNVPIIHIKQWLNDSEISRIKENVYLNNGVKAMSNSIPNIMELFSKKFYYRNDTMNYKELLIKQSKDLIENGYALKGFEQSVIEREKRFTTIYKNGVAGPHALKLESVKDAVSVAVFDKPFEWQGRTVQIVFLINLQQGHLFLHREISRLLLLIMEDNVARERLVSAKDFDQFKIELEKLIKRQG